MKLALDLLKLVRFDDRGNRGRDDLFLRLPFAGAGRHPVEFPLTLIGRVGEDLVDGADAKCFALARAIAAAVEPFDDLFDAKRARRAVTMEIELENELDGFGIDGIDGQGLLDLGAALFDLDEDVAKRDGRTVPEALLSVELHVPQNVFCVLFGLIFIEQRNDLAHHRLRRIIIVAEWLGNRDQLDALFGQFAQIKFLAERVAKEPAIAMHGDNIERVVTVAGALDHLLENRPLVVRPCRSSFDKLRHGLMALGFAPRQNLRPLIRDRQIVLPLSIR